MAFPESVVRGLIVGGSHMLFLLSELEIDETLGLCLCLKDFANLKYPTLWH